MDVKKKLGCKNCGKVHHPIEDMKECIEGHYERIAKHLNDAYIDMEAKLIIIMGVDLFKKNKAYLIESSSMFMQRALISERFNLEKSMERAIKENVIGRKVEQ